MEPNVSPVEPNVSPVEPNVSPVEPNVSLRRQLAAILRQLRIGAPHGGTHNVRTHITHLYRARMKVGLDIGYSSVKVAYGTGGMPETLRLPVGAGPAETCATTLDGKPDFGAGRIVLVNSKEWVAAVEPERLRDYVQIMDPGYPWTDEYRALYYASLDMIDAPVIDHLVTGLPVAQFRDGVSRERLTTQLQGRHYIRPDRCIKVKNVKVVPQPVGAYGSYSLDSARGVVRPKLDMGMSVLIVDSGHYSLDWVLYRLGWQLDSSGSTTTAGDVVIERAAARLGRDLGRPVSKNSMRNAVMRAPAPLKVGGTEVDFWPAINDEAEGIVRKNLNALRGSVRGAAEDGLSLVLVAGGGASLFRDALGRAFDGTPVVAVPDAVHANARGFYVWAGRD